MSINFIELGLILAYANMVYSVSVFINTTSKFNFQGRIIKAEVT